MNKEELKTLVQKYFNLQDKTENTSISSQKFVEATLIDGTRVTNSSDADFEAGQTLFVITEEGNTVTAPEGEHVTESGIVLIVDAQGVLTEVRRADEATAPVAEQAMQDVMIPVGELPVDVRTMMEGLEDMIEKKVAEAVASLVYEVEDMKKKMGDYMSAASSAPTVEARFNKIQEVKNTTKAPVTADPFGFRKAQMDLVVKNFKNRKSEN